METFPDISGNLRRIMKERDMNGVELSLISQVPPPRISDLRTGKVKNPRIKTITKLARALSVSLDDLVA